MGLKERWMRRVASAEAKEAYAEKVEEKKQLWHDRATSEAAELAYAAGVIAAAAEGRRAKALKDVRAEEWAEAAKAGFRAWTPSEKEAEKWEAEAGPYIDAVREIADYIKKIGLSGPVAAKFWATEVVPRLKEAKDKPELLTKVVNEAKAAAEKYLPEQKAYLQEALTKAQKLVEKLAKEATKR